MPGNALLHRALIQIVHHSTFGVPVGFKVGARFEELGAETKDATTAFLGRP